MGGSVFSPEALEANRHGRLSAAQTHELTAYRESLKGGSPVRWIFRAIGTNHDEIREGTVLLFEGVTVRKEWEPEDKEYQIEAASRQEGIKTFWSLEDLYNFAPEKGPVRLYYLPRTRWAVNLERLPTRPVTRADLDPGSLKQRLLETTPQRTPDPVERAYLAAEVDAVHRVFRTYLPGGAPLPSPSGRQADPRSVAAALAGQWWNPGLTAHFRSDGTVTVAGRWVAALVGALADSGARSGPRRRSRAGRRSGLGAQSGPSTRSGTWTVGADGRLWTDALGTPIMAEVVITGNELTLVIDGDPWRFDRSGTG